MCYRRCLIDQSPLILNFPFKGKHIRLIAYNGRLLGVKLISKRISKFPNSFPDEYYKFELLSCSYVSEGSKFIYENEEINKILVSLVRSYFKMNT